MKIQTVIAIMVLLFATACNDEDISDLNVNNSDTLTFGVVYGFCFGDECVQLFKLEDDELYKTNFERFVAEEPINFDGAPLPEADYELANPLRQQFSDALLNTRDTILGIPDAYDQGGIFIQLETDNVSRYWMLDTNIEALPTEVQPYAKQVFDVWLELTEE